MLLITGQNSHIYSIAVSFIFILSVISIGNVNAARSRNISARRLRKAMEDHGVVNDVIDTVPTYVVKVNYSSRAVVKLGNELTPTQVKDPPIQVKWPTQSGAYYTLCMTDPDAPSRQTPEYREFLHWLIVNIPNNDIGSGETLSEYIGSGPPKGTGLHRYVFLVYKQPGKINPDEKRATNRSIEGRKQFHIRNFAKKYNLGEPIAGNFYQAQWDDYVPKLHEQLRGK